MISTADQYKGYNYELLAPVNDPGLRERFKARADDRRYERLLSELQHLRGSCYVEDGAIPVSLLDREGRFPMSRDQDSWHLLLLQDDQVVGCVRYLVHDLAVQYHDLVISRSQIAKDSKWQTIVQRAIQADLVSAREHRLRYLEIGGWALAHHCRHTRAALDLLVGSFALGSLWGGCLGCCTATVRHASSSMLRRLGGQSLTYRDAVVPVYYDQAYKCEMELLRFDYRKPAARYISLIQLLQQRLSRARVTTREEDCIGFSQSISTLATVLGYSPAAALQTAELSTPA